MKVILVFCLISIVAAIGYRQYGKTATAAIHAKSTVVTVTEHASSPSISESQSATPTTPDAKAEISAYIQSGAKTVLGERAQATLLELIKMKVRDQMKDPESTQFRNLRLVRRVDSPEPRYNLCGEVNSKNSFGGYVGFQRFASDGSAGGATIDASGETFRRENFENYWRYVGCS